MPIFSINNWGSVGLVRDTPFYQLAPPAWTTAVGVRFREGAVQAMDGEEKIADLPPEQVAHMASFYTPSRQQLTAVMTDTKVYALQGSGLSEITRASGGYSAFGERRWTSTNLTGVPVFNKKTDVPQAWLPAGAGTRLQDLPFWPSDWRALTVRSFRNFLIALNTQENAFDFPYLVRWSDAADPGTVPTEWQAQASNLAGAVDLADTEGHVVDCAPLGELNVVYKEDSVWAMSFVGGRQVFGFRKLFHDFGAAGPNCVANYGRRHIVLTRDDIVLHDGSSWDSILTTRLRREIFATLTPEKLRGSQVFAHPAKEEVWVLVPDLLPNPEV